MSKFKVGDIIVRVRGLGKNGYEFYNDPIGFRFKVIKVKNAYYDLEFVNYKQKETSRTELCTFTDSGCVLDCELARILYNYE